MALQDSDIFLIHGPESANPGSSYQIQAKDLFSGTYDNYYVLVNESNSSYRCKINELFSADEKRGGIDRILLVNRGDESYQVTLTEILDKYGSFAAPGQREYSGSGINGFTGYFTVPAGVRYISVICVGGGGGGGAAFFAGGGGGGGELAYRNNIKVKPGQRLKIVTGRGGDRTTAENTGDNTAYGGDGGDTYIQDIDTGEYLCHAGGGKGGSGTPYGNYQGLDPKPPGAPDNAGPWRGGAGGWSQVETTGIQIKNRGGTGGEGGGSSDGRDSDSAGGGAAPGSYTKTGAPGQNSRGSLNIIPDTNTGGAAGGKNGRSFIAGSGGGIGLKGIGNRATSPSQGGSGGASSQSNPETGGFYGGGGGGQSNDNKVDPSAYGGRGGARIIWGEGRSYPYNADDR